MNERLLKLLYEWKSEGSPQQGSFDGSRSRGNWVKSFPNHSEFIKSLPPALSRGDVRNICESSTNGIIEKFLVVMVWGYGDRGYGPYRVSRMLSQENAQDVLSEVHSRSRIGNAKTAYDFFRKNRINGLGPSYSSKFITFCTPREVSAPIYDSYVALWIDKFAPHDFVQVPTSSITWNLKTYSRYCDWINEHANYFECFPDEVELALFRDAQKTFAKNSSWEGK